MRFALSIFPVKMILIAGYSALCISFVVVGLGNMWGPGSAVVAFLGFFVSGWLLLGKIVGKYSSLTSPWAPYFMFLMAWIVSMYLPAFVGERDLVYVGVTYIMYSIIAVFIFRLMNEYNINDRFEYDARVFAGTWFTYILSAAVLTSAGLAMVHHFVDYSIIITYGIIFGLLGPEFFSGRIRSAVALVFYFFAMLLIYFLLGIFNPSIIPMLNPGETYMVSHVVCFSLLTSRCLMDVVRKNPERWSPVMKETLIEEAKEIEKVVKGTIELENSGMASAYYGCLSWLRNVKAIIKSTREGYIEAYQKGTRSGPEKEKAIEIHLEERGEDVMIHITLGKPRKGPSEFEKYRSEIRAREWPRLVENLEKHLKKLSQARHSKLSVVTNIKNALRNLSSSRPPLTTVSDVIYEKLPPISKAKSWGIVLVSGALLSAFYVLFFWPDLAPVISNISYLIATYGVGILFLCWVYLSDRYEKEPWRLVIFVFAWGVFLGVIAAPLNRLFGQYFEILGTRALVAAFVEEPLKAVGLFLLISHKTYGKEVNTPLDGVVYGFSTGVGFFAMENFMYFLKYGFSNLAIRSVLCWGHGVYTAAIGLWLAIAKVSRGRIRIIDVLPGLLVAMLLHFLWNGWGAWIGLLGEEFMGLGGQIIFLQALLQMLYLFRMVDDALRDEKLWGYATGMAPVETYTREEQHLN